MTAGEVREMLVRHRRMRPWRALAYFLLAAGGLVIWIDPTRQLEGVPFLVRWVWTGFIAVGGLVSTAGAITDRWLLELVSLPLIFTGFGAFAFILGAGDGNTARWAFAAWLASIAVQTMRRWGSLLKFSGALRRAKREGESGA